MKKIPIPTVIMAFVLILVVIVYWITYQVRFSEAVVKVRFGKPMAVVTEPGLKLKWPYPIETVKSYDMRLRVLDTPETEIKTVDAQNVIVGCFAFWRIEDPLLFSISLPAARTAEDKLRDRIRDSRDKIIGQHKWSDFVNLDSDLIEETYARIQGEILQDCAPGIKSDYGVVLERVGIRRISLPEEATAAVQKAMQEERNRMANRYRQEGDSLKEAIIARAESQSMQILAFAERKATEIETAGLQASQRVFEQIAEQDAEFFIWLRWLEALEASLQTRTTIFLDTNDEIFKHFSEPPTESALESE
jgi:membrane protease subunit HflC